MPLTPGELDDAYLANALFTLHRENWNVYGVRKLWHAARRQGLELGRDQVARLMGSARITGVDRCRHLALVQRNWDATTGPDQLWVADFSYVWTLVEPLYVAFVVDVLSRRSLGWRVATSMRTLLVTDALRQAIDTHHRTGAYWEAGTLVHHGDAGAQGGCN